MKPLFRLAIASAALMQLSSCALPDLTASTGTYSIKTTDGREVLCNGEPLLQENTGYYRYRTFEKRDAVIRKDDVASIQKRSA